MDIAVTSHLYKHHVLTPNRPQWAIIKAAPNSKSETSSRKATENLTRLRQSAKNSAIHHPSPLTIEQLDVAQAPEGDLFLVVGELLYSPDSSEKAPKPKQGTSDSNGGKQEGEVEEEEEEPNVRASHLVCTKARAERCNLFALVSDREGKSWTFLSLPQTVNDWVAYYQEFTGYPVEVQESQHKKRRAAWKQRITAFCAPLLGTDNCQGGDKTSAVRVTKELQVLRTSAEVGQNSSYAEHIEQSRAFQLTMRLLYPDDPNDGLDEYEVEEIAGTCQITKQHIREISHCVWIGLLANKPALSPFKHQAFIFNCSILARNAAKRNMAVVWDNIIEDAFDMAWNTTCPQLSDRGAWSSQAIVIDD
ncbi:hypothetical protein NEUTE1DRAFT_97596 [Neurospora tetrasperma FGSC 2508]|uniref:Uncharacterized protein n=1 Tax=Neurospora tetrasperma (strain FGSC 2508 / ATCC MYA-4615 / P0657) TaxID=510951 RepID=F8MCC7_NEUT8|nr:uncharacterized protein NEUTE1DRAFT_97596 [Neurospora tetrasperma FGSC 2508]EGO60428.1 hypothetical protein NEUTE1DRAFT_97596 [Neurospora tetrasperma FGSC 2508]EGZ75596.1 hypothetical protein NEUTE2DRAFT_164454 [Neurospora tetrasperma FGSC 2509]